MSEYEARPITPDVLNTLVENHRRFLAFVERRVGSREVAEDILQDAFVRGLAAAPDLREQDSAVAWCYRMLRNAMIDHWRRRATEQRAVERVATLAGEEEPAVDDELMETVCSCVGTLVGTLKPEYAEAVRQVDLASLSVKDFAESAGITANNASVRLFRGREALRRQLVRACGTCADHGCLDCSCEKSRPGV